jgi:hypothetical protein
MPNTFKNQRAAATGSLASVYACPASTTAIVLLAQATNVSTGAQAVTLCWYDSSASNVKTEIVKSLSVPQGSSVGLLAGKLVLEAGDYISIQSTASSLIEFSFSVLEIT